MPNNTEIERRNRSLIAFTLLTGARDRAIASMKLKHIDLMENKVFQDAREVKTKFSKTFTTYFFPVGDDVQKIVSDWVNYLRKDLLWGNDDPLFPKTKMGQNKDHDFHVIGLDNDHWSNAAAIRKIFKDAFISAGLPYFNPHSFRNTLVGLGQKICKTPEEFKAWSQNLGHEQVMTTFTSYGKVSEQRQSGIIKNLSLDVDHRKSDVGKLAEAIVKEMHHQNNRQ